MTDDHTQVEILIVEDNYDDATLAIRALKKQHLANKLIHLKDGEEALQFIFGNTSEEIKPEHLPKVILLDLKMPKVNGLEVLEKLKSDPRTRPIPVVILTSSSEDPDIKKSYMLGANSYIVKPVAFENFSKAVAELGFYWLMVNKVPGYPL